MRYYKYRMEPNEPKTYIRTLAGDMDALKKGGVPEFTPLRERTAIAKPPAVPPVRPAAPEPLPTVVPQVQPPRPAELKTYSGDFSERVKEMKASTATILAAEQDMGSAAPLLPEEPKSRAKNPLYIIGGVLLLIIGVVSVYIAYDKYLSASTPIISTPVVTAPIFVDDRQEVSGSGTALSQSIVQSVTDQIPRGSIRFLYFGSATTTSVFGALKLPAPGALLRNISAENSMAGVIFINGVQSPFFILSVMSYGETFAGMLQWESTMARDLAKLFPSYASPTPPKTSTATSTASATSTQRVPEKTTPPAPVFTPGFRDEVVSNHDTRVYRDSAGRVVLLYGYWNQATLVIARNAAAFTEIIGRLATSRAKP